MNFYVKLCLMLSVFMLSSNSAHLTDEKSEMILSEHLYNLILFKKRSELERFMVNSSFMDYSFFCRVCSKVEKKLNRYLFGLVARKNYRAVSDLITSMNYFVEPLLSNVINASGEDLGHVDHVLPFAVKLFCDLIFSWDGFVSFEKWSSDISNVVAIMAVLISSGADIDAKISLPGSLHKSTSLDVFLSHDVVSLTENCQKQYLSVIKHFVDSGADCRIKSQSGQDGDLDLPICCFSQKSALEVAMDRPERVYKEIVAIFDNSYSVS